MESTLVRAAREWAAIDAELASAQRALVPRALRNLIEARLEQAAARLRDVARADFAAASENKSVDPPCAPHPAASY